MKKLILLFNLLLFIGFVNAQVAPNLGSASSFGILSGGNINSTDTIIVNGNAGAMGTIDAKIIATTIYSGGGSTVTNALADMNTAKLFLTSQSGTSISGTLGGQTLNAGVYNISGNAFLNDTINLNGDTNAIFIFNITGDLTINTNAMVKTGLYKSVNPKKIFWNIGGGTTINSNAVFGGVVLSTNAITISGRFAGSVCLLSQQNISFNEAQMAGNAGYILEYKIYSYDNFPKAVTYLACVGPGIFNCGDHVDNGSFEYFLNCPQSIIGASTSTYVITTLPYPACSWDVTPLPGFFDSTPDLFNICSNTDPGSNGTVNPT